MSFEDEYDSLVDEARKRTKTASKDYIPKCCDILRKQGLSREKITRRIRQDFGDFWGPTTIYDAIPDEYKKDTKPRKIVLEERIPGVESILLEQSSTGGSHQTIESALPSSPPPQDESHKIRDEEEHSNNKPELELVHRTIRITMSPKSMIALGNAMIAKVKAEGFKTNYAIEYDYVDKALYVDVTEPKEKVLMISE